MMKNNNGMGLILTLLMVVLLGGCNKIEVGSLKYPYNFEGYSEYHFTSEEVPPFRFKYPAGWIIEEIPAIKASDGIEASPDWGARIYQEGYEENTVYLFGSFSPTSIIYEPTYSKSEFIVNELRKGDSYTKIAGGTVSIYVLYDKGADTGYQNAIVNMEEGFYKQHKEVIWHIIASVEY
ncbi:MAG: hypothetical protein ACK4M9_03685 [Anaerobacillus sp.]|uniref:hypothetical protein n=1 Tax=Anaerobacillus sp. TaxID=1872506 RepID=UPI00391AD4C8